jgi:glucose/arabinose dehydrogenase
MAPLKLTLVTSKLSSPLLGIPAPGDADRLFIVERGGTVRVLKGGVLADEPFLDLSKLTAPKDERGLLGMAFHPGYAENGRFFVHYTDTKGDSAVAEYHRGADADHADPASAQIVLTQAQPEPNHNGGHVVFGPDGMLYIGLGDGGGAGDKHGNAGNGQDLGTWLGKILRIDVSSLPYKIPDGNMTGAGVKPEIWDYGLRNPWRFEFDPCTGDMYIADVGQSAQEEVNFEPAGQGRRNYGWRLMEGTACYNPATNCQAGAELVQPVATYDHLAGCSISGGFVYRGSALPAMRGMYFYGDYCSGQVWALRMTGGNPEPPVNLTSQLGSSKMNISSFGLDAAGEIYIVTLSGSLFRIEPQLPGTAPGTRPSRPPCATAQGSARADRRPGCGRTARTAAWRPRCRRRRSGRRPSSAATAPARPTRAPRPGCRSRPRPGW